MEAIVKLATAAPLPMVRNFRIGREVAHHGDYSFTCHVVTYLPLQLRKLGLLSFAKNLRTDDGFVQVQQTIEFVAGGRLSGVVDHDVVTFGLAGDFVGKLATAPDVDVLDGTAFLGDEFPDTARSASSDRAHPAQDQQ